MHVGGGGSGGTTHPALLEPPPGPWSWFGEPLKVSFVLVPAHEEWHVYPMETLGRSGKLRLLR